jgi:hypothetical protein
MEITPFGQGSDPFDTDSLAVHCPRCQIPLVLHQPDPELEDRLLATCDECKAWYLVDCNENALTRLPEAPDDGTPVEPA